MEKTQKTLGQLALPICFELLLLMLTGTIDTLMLSSVGDQAVAAVGTANTYISMFILMFSVISSGMMAVMTQNIGANKPGVAYQACKLGSILNAAFGIVLGVLLFTKAKTILELVGIASALKEPAAIYLSLVGGSCIFNAVIPIYSGYLRAFGYMKQPLWATIIANLTNLILNALFLFIFDMGVTGIAIATVISKALNFIIVYISSHILIQAHDKSSYLPSSQVLLQIVKIGLPSAMETVFYHISLALVMRYLNQMDSDGLNVAARSYSWILFWNAEE